MAEVSGGEGLEIALREIARKLDNPVTLSVGFLEGSTYPDGTSVPFVAAMNEFGHGIGANPGEGEEDTRERVPPRPFFRNMVSAKSGEWPAAIAGLLVEYDYDAEKVMKLTGEALKGQLQQSIRDTNEPPLAESTIKKKGFDKPLIDTSVMINSVDYKVE